MTPRPGRSPRGTAVDVRLAAVTALLVVAVGTVLLAASYWLLIVRLPDSFVVDVTPSAASVQGVSDCADGQVCAVGGPAYVVDLADGAPAAAPDPAQQLVTSAVADTAAQFESQLRRGFVTQAGLLLLALTVPAVAVGGFAARRAVRPIEAALARERRLMANVSHELRTPLANQHTALEVGLEDAGASPADLRRVAEVALEQNRRARLLIEQLLELARVEQDADADPGDGADLADAARHAAEAVRSLPGVMPDPCVVLDVEPAPVRGHAVLVERLVGNLVENAVRYNEPGGFVRVTTRVVDGAARVEVENSGPVVPPDAVEGLFEPFRRGVAGAGDRVRSGHGVGLGLSLVAAIARRYGARVDARARPAGGLHVAVTFPAAAHASVHDVLHSREKGSRQEVHPSGA